MLCMQCNGEVICNNNKNHALNHTVVVLINRIPTIKNHPAYNTLINKYYDKGCKVLLFDRVKFHKWHKKESFYRHIRHNIMKSGNHVRNVIVYFWEDENIRDYFDTKKCIHPNLFLKDLASHKSFKKIHWFYISVRIRDRRKNPPHLDMGNLTENSFAYISFKTRNYEECVNLLEQFDAWDKMEQLLEKNTYNKQYCGKLIKTYMIY